MNPCGFFKIKVENHKHKKKEILDIAYQYERRVDDHHVKNSFISNTDYEDEIQSLEWAKIVFCDKTSNNLKTKINKLYGEHHIDVVDSWVSQYYAMTSSEHLPHNHVGANVAVNMCCVYYVDLPNTKLSTKFILNGKVVSPKIKEGEMIFFDSKILHFSPPNKTKKDKTIVAMNLYVS